MFNTPANEATGAKGSIGGSLWGAGIGAAAGLLGDLF
jgi:hypothetical protein